MFLLEECLACAISTAWDLLGFRGEQPLERPKDDETSPPHGNRLEFPSFDQRPDCGVPQPADIASGRDRHRDRLDRLHSSRSAIVRWAEDADDQCGRIRTGTDKSRLSAVCYTSSSND